MLYLKKHQESEKDNPKNVRYFQIIHLIRAFYLENKEFYKELLKLNNKKTVIFKWGEGSKQTIFQRKYANGQQHTKDAQLPGNADQYQ